MFVAWILNFQVNLRKIISLEPPMKLESHVNEVFFYQNIHFYMPKLSAAAAIAAAEKLSENGEYLLISFFIPIIKKKFEYFLRIPIFLTYILPCKKFRLLWQL